MFTCVRVTEHAVRMGGGGVSAKNREAVALPVHGSGAEACLARMRGLRGRRAHARRALWGHAPGGYAPQVCGSPSRRAPYFTPRVVGGAASRGAVQAETVAAPLPHVGEQVQHQERAAVEARGRPLVANVRNTKNDRHVTASNGK